MAEDWDFELQHAQTAYTVAELLREGEMEEGEAVTLDLQLNRGEEANEANFLRALKMFGYAGETGEESDIVVSVQGVAFGLEAIWLHEERVSKIALSHGYVPEGWGFWEPVEE